MRLKRSLVFVACALSLQTAAPAAHAFDWPPLLMEGDKGKGVKALQMRVAGWYPRGDQTYYALDGVFADKTRIALKRFQKHYGLVADGIAGPQTFAFFEHMTDDDGSTIHFDYDEFVQNRNSACGRQANRYAGTFKGGPIKARYVKRNIRRLMWRLEALRAKLGDKPIAINSGYRSIPYNACIGGATYSQHQYGTAVDFRVVDVTNRKARDTGKHTQIHGIGCYSSLSHNHFDLRMHNPALPEAAFWWWPEVDEHGRHLDESNQPCWGERKKGKASGDSGSTVDTAPSEAELEEWESKPEPMLEGAD